MKDFVADKQAYQFAAVDVKRDIRVRGASYSSVGDEVGFPKASFLAAWLV